MGHTEKIFFSTSWNKLIKMQYIKKTVLADALTMYIEQLYVQSVDIPKAKPMIIQFLIQCVLIDLEI